MANRSLRTKLTILMSTLLLLVTTTVAIYLPIRIRGEAVEAAVEKGTSIARLTAYGVGAALLFEDRAGAAEAIAGACHDEEVARVIVRDRQGRTFTDCLSAARESLDERLRRVVVVPVRSGDQAVGSVELVVSLEEAYRHAAVARREVIGGALIVLLLSMASVFGIAHHVGSPLRRIAETADRISNGDLASRAVIVGTKDETGRLAEAFNTMLDSLAGTRAEVEDLNRGLELIVADRTRELKQVLESAYDGIFAVNAAGRCTLVNRSGAELLARPAGELVGRSFHDTVHPPSRCSGENCAVLDLLRGGAQGWIKATFEKAGGDPFNVELSAAPISREERVGSVLTFRDVTDREKLEHQLEQSERLSSLGHLAAALAHEFNNVLMGISPFVELIQRSAPDHPAIVRACGTITQSVSRGKGVTQEVLRYTRPAPPNIRPFLVNEWLTDFCSALQLTFPANITLNVLTSAEPLVVLADGEQMEQVVANLITNGRHATAAGGTITVGVETDPTAEWVRLFIADTGHGMDPDTLSRVFEPFFTTKGHGGTGLGMPIAHQLVTRNGGTITVESKVGEGTTFSILLPRGDFAPRPIAQTAIRPARLPQRVLIVEDDESVGAGLTHILEAAGVMVMLVSRGREAVPAIERYHPEAVILDVGLPDVNGVEVYREIAARWSDLPVVFSTGHVETSNLKALLGQSNVAALLKPYDEATLLETLARVLAATSVSS